MDKRTGGRAVREKQIEHAIELIQPRPIHLFAVINLTLFVLYVILGHRLAEAGGSQRIDRLGLSMLIALLVVSPLGLAEALPIAQHPALLVAGIGLVISRRRPASGTHAAARRDIEPEEDPFGPASGPKPGA